MHAEVDHYSLAVSLKSFAGFLGFCAQEYVESSRARRLRSCAFQFLHHNIWKRFSSSRSMGLVYLSLTVYFNLLHLVALIRP